MQVQAIVKRVHWATGSPRHSTSHNRVQTGPEGWLLAERSLSEGQASEQEIQVANKPEKTKYWFSTLPPETSDEHLPPDVPSPRLRDLGSLAHCEILPVFSPEEALLFLLQRSKRVGMDAQLSDAAPAGVHMAEQLCTLLDARPRYYRATRLVSTSSGDMSCSPSNERRKPFMPSLVAWNVIRWIWMSTSRSAVSTLARATISSL
ncbi:hypothetical protein [Reticulibacter mediterranei]|uniref:hypothetical protein n=1 Tax=Reticulibacter mediterranei TaxID=2778369 RepID=UPI001F2455AD|nr:hypothetical protein [Reticulibacter mediterranei]